MNDIAQSILVFGPLCTEGRADVNTENASECGVYMERLGGMRIEVGHTLQSLTKVSKAPVVQCHGFTH